MTQSCQPFTRATVAESQGPAAFTIVELLVASTIVSVALLGVYGIFDQAVRVERDAAARWQQKTAAAALADQMAHDVRHAVNVGKIPAVQVLPDSRSGAPTLICLISGSNSWGASRVALGFRRVRYCWRLQAEGENAGWTVTRQEIPYAGKQNLLLAEPVEGYPDEDSWDLSPPNVVAKDIEDIFVECKKTDGGDRPEKKGKAGNVRVEIRVTVGNYVARRIIYPRVSGSIVP